MMEENASIPDWGVMPSNHARKIHRKFCLATIAAMREKKREKEKERPREMVKRGKVVTKGKVVAKVSVSVSVGRMGFGPAYVAHIPPIIPPIIVWYSRDSLVAYITAKATKIAKRESY